MVQSTAENFASYAIQQSAGRFSFALELQACEPRGKIVRFEFDCFCDVLLRPFYTAIASWIGIR